MALVVTSDTNYITLANALAIPNPGPPDATVMGWSHIESDRGAGLNQTLMMLTAIFGTDADAFARWETAVAGVMDVGSYDGSTSDVQNLSSRPGVAAWFHWFMRFTSNQLTFGWRGILDSSYVTQSATLQPGSVGTVSLMLGYNGFGTGEYLNARFAAVKLWQALLNDTEIMDDSEQYLPVRTANLITANIDESVTVLGALAAYAPGGGGLTFTENGTLSIADGPPIPFGGGATFEESVGFAASTAVIPSSRAVFGSSLAFGVGATIQPPTRLTATALASLSAQAAVTPASLLSSAVQFGLSCSATLSPSNQQAHALALALTADVSLGTSHVLASLGQLTLTAAGLLDVAGQLQIQTLVTLGAAAVLAPVSGLTTTGTVALQAEATLTPVSRLVASALQAFTVSAALDVFTGEQVIQEQLTLSAAANMTPSARAILIAQHTLALSAQLDAAYRAVIQAAVAYGAQADITPTETATIAASLALDVHALVATQTTASMREAVSLAIATSLNAAASLANAPAAGVLQDVADELHAATAVNESLTS